MQPERNTAISTCLSITSKYFISTLLPLLDEYPEYSFYLSEFCRQGQLCRLSDSESWKGESPDGISYSPGDDTFFSQIEEWNEKDEYTKSIRALEAIPEEQQDYRIKMLLVSAYENYAIIGDNDEGTERWKGDRVLLKAIRLMETVRDEGEKKCELEHAYGIRIPISYETRRKKR